MPKTTTWRKRAAALTAAIGLLVSASGAATAQPSDGKAVAFNLAPGGTWLGDLVPGLTIPVPDPNPPQAEGTWSPTTGEFSGTMTGAVIPVPITEPLAVTLNVSLRSSNVSGSIPPDGSPGSVTLTGLTVGLVIPELADCTLTAGDTTLTTTVMSADPFTVAAAGSIVMSVSPLPAGCELLATYLPVGATSITADVKLMLAQVISEPAPEPAPAAPTYTG
jgi:hypothetical protein